MTAQVEFSIVIPVYNRAHSVLPTLQSVAQQTFGNFKCYVVDDGSADGEKLKAVIEVLSDPRFLYFRQDNAGGGAARNTGIAAATGNWIALLDSDDAFLPGKLAAIAEQISARPDIDVWAHRTSMERGQGVAVIRPRRLPREGESITDMMFRQREFLQTSTLVVRAPLAKRVAFDRRLRKAQDVDFIVRLERAGAKFCCIEGVYSIWNDAPAEGRVGAPRRPADVRAWYEEQKQFFSTPTRYAFESTYLAYEIADNEPWRAGGYILRALLSGAVGPKLTALTFMRAFIDQRHYRRIVDRLLPKPKNALGR